MSTIVKKMNGNTIKANCTRLLSADAVQAREAYAYLSESTADNCLPKFFEIAQNALALYKPKAQDWSHSSFGRAPISKQNMDLHGKHLINTKGEMIMSMEGTNTRSSVSKAIETMSKDLEEGEIEAVLIPSIVEQDEQEAHAKAMKEFIKELGEDMEAPEIDDDTAPDLNMSMAHFTADDLLKITKDPYETEDWDTDDEERDFGGLKIWKEEGGRNRTKTHKIARLSELSYDKTRKRSRNDYMDAASRYTEEIEYKANLQKERMMSYRKATLNYKIASYTTSMARNKNADTLKEDQLIVDNCRSELKDLEDYMLL